MVTASTFAGALSLICQTQPPYGVRPEPVTINVRDGNADISGLDDAAVEHGLIASGGPRGALRLVAITLREPEFDIWADLTPTRGGSYALAFYSAPHGTPTPREMWAQGACTVETRNQGTSR